MSGGERFLVAAICCAYAERLRPDAEVMVAAGARVIEPAQFVVGIELLAGARLTETVFYCGNRIVRRNTILRLIQLGHLVDGDPKLFPGSPQRLVVNITTREEAPPM